MNKAKVYYMGCWRRERKPRKLVKEIAANPAGSSQLRIVWKVLARTATHARGLIKAGKAEVVHEKKVKPRSVKLHFVGGPKGGSYRTVDC